MKASANSSGDGMADSSDRLMKPSETAGMLAVSVRTLWRLASKGELRTVRIGKSVRFCLSDVLAIMHRGVA